MVEDKNLSSPKPNSLDLKAFFRHIKMLQLDKPSKVV